MIILPTNYIRLMNGAPCTCEVKWLRAGFLGLVGAANAINLPGIKSLDRPEGAIEEGGRWGGASPGIVNYFILSVVCSASAKRNNTGDVTNSHGVRDHPSAALEGSRRRRMADSSRRLLLF